MKLLTVVGARPQFVKAAALSRAIAASGHVEERILHTGQHYDRNMSDVFFEELGIPEPAINLGVSETLHGAMTARMLEGIETAILSEKPDTVLTYGDTNSTLACALAAAKLHVPCAHVEAGLRSFNMRMPEEINRIIADRLSKFLFCPTETAVRNLRDEGFEKHGVVMRNVGDVMLDAAMHASRLNAISARPNPSPFVNYALATIHRAENTDDPRRLAAIMKDLNAVHRDICPIVLPMHPRTRRKMQEGGIETDVTVLDPVGYLDMISLTQTARLVITDSGGLQKEAYYFCRPCVILRDETEWTELIECGAARLSPPLGVSLTEDCEELLGLEAEVFQTQLFGDGKAGGKIVETLLNHAV
jgi:UDP-GlcNAc3NAcA epimerase